MRYLKLPSLKSGEWVDRDRLMLVAAFQTLCDFIEKERPDEYIDWSAQEDTAHARREIQELYDWWTMGRPARVHPIDSREWDLPPVEDWFEPMEGNPELSVYKSWDNEEWHAAVREANRLEKEWLAEDQAMLHRLVDIRPYLWT